MKNIKRWVCLTSIVLASSAYAQTKTGIAQANYATFVNLANNRVAFETARGGTPDEFASMIGSYDIGQMPIHGQMGSMIRSNTDNGSRFNKATQYPAKAPYNNNFMSVRWVNSPVSSPFLGKLCGVTQSGCDGVSYFPGTQTANGLDNIDWVKVSNVMDRISTNGTFPVPSMSYVITPPVYQYFSNIPIGNTVDVTWQYCGTSKPLPANTPFGATVCDGRMNNSASNKSWIETYTKYTHIAKYNILNQRRTSEVFVDSLGRATINNPSEDTCRYYGNRANTDINTVESGIICFLFEVKQEGPGKPIGNLMSTILDNALSKSLTAAGDNHVRMGNAALADDLIRRGNNTRDHNFYGWKYPSLDSNRAPTWAALSGDAAPTINGKYFVRISQNVLRRMIASPDLGMSDKMFKFISRSAGQGRITDQKYAALDIFPFDPTNDIKISPIDYGVILKETTINSDRTATLPSSTPVKYNYELWISSRDATTYKGPASKISIKLYGDDLDYLAGSGSEHAQRIPGFIKLNGKNYCRFFSTVPDENSKFMEVAIPAYLAYQVGPGQFEKVKGDSSCGDPAEPGIDITPKVSGGTENPAYFTQVAWDVKDGAGNFFKTNFQLVFPLDDTISFRTLNTGASPGVDWMGVPMKGSGKVEVKVEWNTPKK